MSKLVEISPCFDSKKKLPCPNRSYCIKYSRSKCVSYREYEKEYELAQHRKLLDTDISDYITQNQHKAIDMAYRRAGVNKRVGMN